MKTGLFFEWGATKEDNPNWCPFGPTILDIEITTICKGPRNASGECVTCPFCYKSNTINGHNMTLNEFKIIIDKMPLTLTQVAFGADAQAESNPDLFAMINYCREKKLIPNITVADISSLTAMKLAKTCGAVACSAYKHANNFETCYESIRKLVDEVSQHKLGQTITEFEEYCRVNDLNAKETFKKHGMQINIHYMLSSQSAKDTYKVMNDLLNRDELKYVNAIVFLHLKKKGRGTSYDIVSKDDYDKIVNFAFDNEIGIGFDTCGAGRYRNFVNEFKSDEIKKFSVGIEDCCAGRFSAYINEKGIAFPCSFMENTKGDWNTGINVLKCSNYYKDVWMNENVKSFGCSALECSKINGGCPYYKV
jgi:hypothetical protein